MRCLRGCGIDRGATVTQSSCGSVTSAIEQHASTHTSTTAYIAVTVTVGYFHMPARGLRVALGAVQAWQASRGAEQAMGSEQATCAADEHALVRAGTQREHSQVYLSARSQCRANGDLEQPGMTTLQTNWLL